MLTNKGNWLIRGEFPLEEVTDPDIRLQQGFFDYRNSPHTGRATSEDNLTRIQADWKSARWIAANILNWEGEFVLPENLDRLKLPLGDTGKPDKNSRSPSKALREAVTKAKASLMRRE